MVSEEEINILTDQAINSWTSRYCHKIVKKDKKMMKNGKVIPHVSQLQAINKFEQFIEGSEYLIAHGSIDFETIRFLLEKTRDSQIYHGIQKVDSQDF